MVGLVGYLTDTSYHLTNPPLEIMINAIRHKNYHLVDKFYGNRFHIARVDLGIFNPRRQPVFNEDKTLGIMTYGKIYGYEKRIKDLKKLGHIFKKIDDAEYILHEYEEIGERIFEKLNGSFVFILINDSEGKLTIVNDRYGNRPLYYAIEENNLLFASEIKAILKYPYPNSINEETIVKFFRYGKIGILGDDTWFKGINVLPPASVIEVNNDKIDIKKYWELEYSTDYCKNEDEIVNELVEVFKKAVNMRINKRDLFGVSLSGGLDSRSIIASLREDLLVEVQAFTLGTKNCDDIKVAKAVTRKIGLKTHHIIEYESNSLIDYVNDVVYLTDGMGTINVCYIPYSYMKAQEHMDIYFQGLALDLLLGGSYLNAEIMKANNLNELVNILDKKGTLFSRAELIHLLDNSLWPIIEQVEKCFIKMVRNAKGDLFPNKADYFHLNTRVRRHTIMGSVISRNFLEESLPTYDNKLIEIITRIPPQYRYKYHIYKKFLKRLCPKLAAIPYQKTMVRADAPQLFWIMGRLVILAIGFLKRLLRKLSGGRIYLSNRRTYFDFNELLRAGSNWRRLVAETLMNNNSLCYRLGYLNKDFVNKIIKDHYTLRKNNGEKIAFLITYELFLRLFNHDKQ